MNRTVLIVIVVVILAAVGGYFYIQQRPQDAGADAAAGAAGTAGEVPPQVQAAIDFCKGKGGTVETVIAAEGRTDLCVLADGTKAEVSKFMADNKTE